MFKTLRPAHLALAILLACYLMVLGFIVLWPTPVDQSTGHYLQSALGWLHQHGIPKWFNYAFVEWLSNVVMFLPLGFLGAPLFSFGRIWKTAFIGLILSILIESTQFLFFPERTASILDVLANTLGALIGASLFVLFTFLRQKRVRVVYGVPGSLVGDSSVDPEKN